MEGKESKIYYGTVEKEIEVSAFFSERRAISSNYNELFSDPLPGQLKRLSMPSLDLTISENTPFIYDPQAIINEPPTLLFFLPAQEKEILLLLGLLAKLKDLFLSSEKSRLYIDFLLEKAENEETLRKLILSSYPLGNLELTFHAPSSKTVEYFSLTRLRKEARSQGQAFLFYFLLTDLSRRAGNIDQDMLEALLGNWQRCIEIFTHLPSIQKIGYRANRYGYLWHNAFWVRASYARTCEKVIETSNRFYYESWLARSLKKKGTSSASIRELDHPDYLRGEKDVCSLCKEKDNIGPVYYS